MLNKKLLIAATAAAMLPALVAMDVPHTPLQGENQTRQLSQRYRGYRSSAYVAYGSDVGTEVGSKTNGQPERQSPADAPPAADANKPLIQIAILLDTSNSMDGLIDQAKTHLWQIVNEFATAKQDGQRPDLRVALFEYGNDGLPAEENHIRLVVPLTNDLDKISEELFALRTNGGSEYCGTVIQKAADVLTWSKDSKDFKAIFIAGNEPFTQGPKPYTEACKAAITKGIIVNTIFCGDRREGIRTKWQEGATLADGAFVSINQNARAVHVAAPQDKEIAKWNAKLNGTYVAYGREGQEAKERQAAQDENAKQLDAAVLSSRASAKAGALYSNARWDLCDACIQGKVDIDKLDKIPDDQLPEEMRKMNKEERKQYVQEKIQEREAIKKKISELSQARDKHIAAEKKKLAEESGEKSLEEAVIESVRAQAGEKGFIFEKDVVEAAPDKAPQEVKNKSE